MQISEKLSEDFKAALKSGDKNKVSILRVVKAAIKNREIKKGSAPDEEEIYAILRYSCRRRGIFGWGDGRFSLLDCSFLGFGHGCFHSCTSFS